jgi:23S rRNA (adenine1618-N6)-methyltransferase
VSKKEHLKPLEVILNQKGAKSILVLPMQQGNKMSRILAWSFNE